MRTSEGMYLKISCVVLCSMALVAVVNAFPADTPIPLIPCEFYGTVSINGLPAPAGTVIAGIIDNQVRGSITTIRPGFYGGNGAFDKRLFVMVEEGDENKIINFTINGLLANQSRIFQVGGSDPLDLTAFVDGPQPTARFDVNRSMGFAPMTVRFTDTSDCINTTYHGWVFGDGKSSYAPDPVYTYLRAGNFTALLTIANSTGTNTTVTGQIITVYLRGDFNHNGDVDIGDVALVAYMVVNKAPAQVPDADFNNNGFVDIGDAVKISWFSVGKITAL